MNYLFTSILLSASLALAGPSLVKRDVEILTTLTYTGPIIPGGGNITLVGDAKSIYDQIMNINPGYKIEDFNVPDVKRDLVDRSPISHQCNVAAGASYRRIQEGIAYLNALGAGLCGLGPKPACTRVSCSYDSAIYYCNDNSVRIGVACNYLGYGMAQRILDDCATCGGNCLVSGQIWDQDNYNVIVSASNNFGEGHC